MPRPILVEHQALTAHDLALSWTYDHRPNEEGMFPYYDKTIWEIIYELTGIRRRQRIIPSHIQVLKDFLHPSIPESKHILPTISESISALRHLNVSNDTFEIVKTITVIQNSLPKLQSAFQSEHDTAIPTPPEPISTDISSSPTTTPHPGISRTPSTIISNPGSAPYLSLSLHPPSPSNLLSLTLVNHFHRTHALSVLASILIFDFSDNIEAIYALHTPFTSQYIKLINLLFVEGYMPLPIVSHLLAHGSNSTLLPSLRELSIKIWPRDPTREDRGDIRWGGQTHELLQTLRGFREGTVKVVVGFRLESDCGRFEEGYVGWRRRRWGVDGKDRGQVEGGSVCRRFYELERN